MRDEGRYYVIRWGDKRGGDRYISDCPNAGSYWSIWKRQAKALPFRSRGVAQAFLYFLCIFFQGQGVFTSNRLDTNRARVVAVRVKK
jgi:hypothetical protein